jgi:hypothetical protein
VYCVDNHRVSENLLSPVEQGDIRFGSIATENGKQGDVRFFSDSGRSFAWPHWTSRAHRADAMSITNGALSALQSPESSLE